MCHRFAVSDCGDVAQHYKLKLQECNFELRQTADEERKQLFMKILVAIANYGKKNRAFAEQLIENFRNFQADVDIVVLSEADKSFGEDVEVRVGLPTNNPWSLPFAHRDLFAERKNDYDVFIYTEDDTEILEQHVIRFLEVTEQLPKNMLAGFIRYEIGPDNKSYYSTVHGHYHWDVGTLFRIGEWVFSRYTNDHSACFILTRQQLVQCIESGGFLVQPHEGPYDMLCSAATDPYTQCGFTKVLCVSHIEEFSLHHLPDIYLGRIGIDREEINRQVAQLIEVESSQDPCGPLIRSPKCSKPSFAGKIYYDGIQDAVIDLIPRECSRVLSVGCERGLTESELVKRGHQVTAVPMDCVIAESPKMRGVKVTTPDFDIAARELDGEKFDVIWFNNLLGYVAEPADLIRRHRNFLNDAGRIIVSFDNHRSLRGLKRRLRNRSVSEFFKSNLPFEESGFHRTHAGMVASWLRQAGFDPTMRNFQIEKRFSRVSKLTMGLSNFALSERGAISAVSMF